MNMKNQKMLVDLRIVCAVLIVAIIAMIVIWKPWNGNGTERTISVSGDSSQKAEPDEYQFSPMYQEKGSDRTAIQKSLADKINTIIVKLRELGVAESDITLASSTYDNWYNDGTSEVTSNSLTVIVSNKELSQKVQDYLLTTAPQGQITPYPTFSKEKRKKVEEEVRSQAITDAKKKAERTASELGMKLGKVVTITDQQGGGIMPMYGAVGGGDAKTMSVETSTLPVLAGKQDINYTVEVVYEIK